MHNIFYIFIGMKPALVYKVNFLEILIKLVIFLLTNTKIFL